jgi:trimeric autotransporter adhesin
MVRRSTLDVGAVTWGNGAAGTTGVVGTANSLVGTTRYDEVGGSSIVGLSNGNYVVTTPYWDNGVLLDVGAVTWVSGTTPTTGVIGVTNSLVGSTVSDRVGSGVVALPNGSYVVVSGFWNNGSIVEAGAVTWVSGATRTTGVIGPANSLVGSSVENRLGVGGIVVLPNGNYLVVNPFWLNPSQGIAGAVTWASGATGITGVVGPTNSLVGTSDRDRVGSDGVVLLPNGNYLVSSRQWDDGPAADVGAVTWGSGATGITGVVSSANSLIGSTSKDDVGYNIIVLSDGNYVVLSPNWDNGPALDAGAVTWGNSATGTSGVVGAANSLVGMVYNEGIGTGVGVLSNGNYVVSRGWGPDGGAVTWVKGSASFAGVASAENSLVGTASDGLATFVDRSQSVVTNDDGSYIVLSQYWDHGVASFGAATYGPASGITGVISFANSAVGTVPGRFLDVAERRTSAGAYAIATNQNRVVLLFPGTPRVPPISTAPGVPPVNPGPGAAPTEFVPLSPGRLADTRPSGVTVDSVFAAGGTRAADSTLELTVGGRGGVTTTAQAVSLNITAVDASADGYATVFPCGSPRPNASNLNYRAGHTQANAVITKLGTSGKVCVYVSSATQLIVDVNGSFPVTSLLVSANPARVLDTRATGETVDNLERAGGLRAAGSITTLPIAGRADVPADAKAVIVNVTATGPTNDGYLTVYPCGSPVPNASNLNYTSATSIANLVISKLGAGGQLCIKTSAATHLIVDVTGYFPAGSAYEPLQPARLLDSRAAGVTIDNQFPAAGLRPAGTITELTVGGRGGVTGDAKTLVLNITATDPTADGFISVYPCGIAPPNASNLNFAANSDVANTVIVKPGTAGKVCLYNSSPTHLIADANGYLLT